VGWDKGRYCTRSRKVNGRVVREYVGTGPLAQLAAQMDAIARQEREAHKEHLRQVRAELDVLDADLEALGKQADLAARAALVAAGFRQHKRGEWRRRRVPTPYAGPGPVAIGG
jgi:hypothetical protein